MEMEDNNAEIKIIHFDGDLNSHMDASNNLVTDAAEYDEHFLSQLAADPLVLSSSQVSSLLSELEPSQSPLINSDTLSTSKLTLSDKCASLPLTNSLLSVTVNPTTQNKRYHAIKCIKMTLGHLSWYRCSVCPFLASAQDLMTTHYTNLHVDSFATELRCLECKINFTRLHNLKHHYIMDHLVSLSDLQNMTKLTVEANHCWRMAKEKKGKTEDCSILDSTIPEATTAEQYIPSDGASLVENVANILAGGRLSMAPPVSLTDASQTSVVPLMTFEIEQFTENVEEIETDDKKRLKEEEAKKAEIKAEKEEKAIWKCTLDGCSLKFSSEKNVDYHRMCHEGNSGQWKCPECNEMFTKWSEISIHLWRRHEINIDLYSCDLCDFKTNNLSKLMNLHRRTHGNDRPYLCDTCGKGFKTTKQLGTHKTHHNKNKKPTPMDSVNCDICSRKFTDSRLLRTHMDIVHRGLRPYVCKVCSHSASSMSSLKMHLRSHTGEKPYSCPFCDYTTADHNSLRRHKMRHSGAKHYKCPHCSYASIQSTTYKDHLKNKHPGQDGGLMFCCSFCSFRTVNHKNFLTHVSSHSNGIIEKTLNDSKVMEDSIETLSE